MIPIRLELQAFMPFRTKQTLDFSAVSEQRLFLVSGSTGSGKTSIFDAICFALYGEASGSVRDRTALKSHFADDSTEAYVEFTFESKGKTYHIRRTPAQNKLRRGGNITPTAATAVLTLEDGTVLSKAGEVNRHIEEILGINLSQFKKIMMLPQGEFQKFLTDSSKDKQEILRKIFDTGIYESMAEELRIKNNELSGELQNIHTRLSSYTEQFDSQGDDALTEMLRAEHKDYPRLLKAAEMYHTAKKEKLSAIVKQIEQQEKKRYGIDIEAAQQTNDKIDLLEKTEKEYQLLTAQDGEINALKKRTSQLSRVREISADSSHAEQTRKRILQVKEDISGCEQRLKQTKKQWDAADKLFGEEDNIYRSLPETAQEISRKEQQLSLFEEYRRQTSELEQLQKQHSLLKQFYRSYQLENKLAESREALRTLRAAQNAVETCVQLDMAYTDAVKTYQTLFSHFLSGQAHMLSQQLTDGLPCPVCGALEHPDPAKNAGRSVTEAELEQGKKKYERAAEQLRQHQIRLDTIWQKLSVFSFMETAGYDETAKEYRQRLRLIKQLIETVTEQGMAYSREQKALSLPDYPVYADLTEEQYQDEDAALSAAAALKEKQKQETERLISDSETDEQKLKQEIRGKKQYLQAHQSAYQNALKERSKARSELDRLTEALKQQNTLYKELSEQYETQKQAIAGKLEETGISKEEYHVLCAQLSMLEIYEQRILAWEQDVSAKRSLIKVYRQELKGKHRLDIEAMKLEAQQIDAQLDLNKQAQESLQKTCTLNHRMLKSLREYYKQNEILSKKYNEINLLYQTASGKTGDRISFERYVLGVYFDSVIESANQRLSDMTDSRYFLRRRAEKEKGNVSSGLDLEIFDSYSGRFRHVNSLSGGESFKTALSLALGLADVMSRQSGGIEISTLFIDEGFGTLDEESLDHAVDSLVKLKDSGKYIGIISHVKELKEKIPVQLVVQQTKQGSECRFIT